MYFSQSLFAPCFYFGWLYFPRLVAPGIALVGDHGGDLGVGKLLAERRHGGVRLAVQHHVDMLRLGAGGDLRAVERRERRRHALAARLVAGDAVRRVDPLAASLEVLEAPLLVRVIGLRDQRLFLVADPLAVVRLRNHAHHDRHEAVLLAAQLGALAAEDSGPLGPAPGVPKEAATRALLV